MKKALLLAIAVGLTVLASGPTMAQGSAPSIGTIPDVILGDSTGGQTVGRYYVYYNGLNLEDYVFDEDGLTGLKSAYWTPQSGDRNLSIEGKSRAASPTFGRSPIGADKNLTPGNDRELTFRAASDIYSSTGMDDVPTEYLPGIAGYGLSGNQALVDLLVEDATGNTETTQFLVKIGGEGTVSTLEGGSIETTTTFFEDQFGFTFGTINNPAGVPAYVGLVPGADGDTLQTGTGHVPAGSVGFGWWERTFYTGSAWRDAVIRAKWTVSSNVATPAEMPTVRSRVGAGNLFDKMVSTLSFSATGLAGDSNIQQMVGGNQRVIDHFTYLGNTPQMLASEGGILVAFDTYDFTDTQAGRTDIDAFVLELLPHASLNPADGDAQNLVTQAGTQLHTWNKTQLIPLEADTNGGIVWSDVAEGIRGLDTATAYNLFGNCDTQALGTTASGDLFRLILSIQDNNPASTTHRTKLRGRLAPDHYEFTSALEVPGDLGTDVRPGETPSTYEMYVNTPASLFSINWTAALDFITAEGNPDAGGRATAGDFTLTQVQLQQVLTAH